MGGQAVLEGVMMRGENTWAVAVRNPDGEIVVDVRDVPGWSERYRKIPILRGVMGLGESLGLGYRALTWSANQQVPEEEQVSEKTMGFAVIFSMLVFAGLFIVLPLFVGGRLDDVSILPFHLSEGIVRLALFVGYLVAISFIPDIRRVFQYHGAEHKTIAAYENDVELTPESADQFTTAHVRCGTNFLLTVMVVAIFVYSFIPTPNFFVIIASRRRADPGDRRTLVRSDPARREEHATALGAGVDEARPVAPEADDPRTRPRAARGRDRIDARRAHRRTDRRGRGAARRAFTLPPQRSPHSVSLPAAGIPIIRTHSPVGGAAWLRRRGAGRECVGRLRPASLCSRSRCRSPSLRCPRSESRPTAPGRSPYAK